MARNRTTELSEFLEDVEHLTDDYEVVSDLVKRCKCGYRGTLIADVDGHVCRNCGYLLVPK